MDTASPQSGAFVLPLLPEREADDAAGSSAESHSELDTRLPGVSTEAIEELWRAAAGEACDLRAEEFAATLSRVGVKHNFGFPHDVRSNLAQRVEFLRSLRLADLALASACALGRETAWEKFLKLYRAPLTQAAVAIAGSATVGHDLADSLYAELYGLRAGASDAGGERRSPLASYSGRGSLLGWLRTTLAQRHVDHHRRTHRETPLDAFDAPAAEAAVSAAPAETARLADSIARTLAALGAEDRFLLTAYFLDQQRLLEIARTLHVHEATISRRLKRLTADLRKRLMEQLQAEGRSRRAAEEALGADPRDIEINLRSVLQSSQIAPFPGKSPDRKHDESPDRKHDEKQNQKHDGAVTAGASGQS